MDSLAAEVLAGFSDARPFDRAAVETAPNRPGVHVVWSSDGRAIYVGHSGKTRSRLLQHLSGDREASILHSKVGRMLDAQLGRSALAAEIRDWLGTCTFAFRDTEKPEELKSEIVGALHPEFNERLPASRPIESGRSGDAWESIPGLLNSAMAGLRDRDSGHGSIASYKKIIESDLPAALSSCVPAGFDIRGRTGIGTAADVPWVGIFPHLNGSAMEGIYVVLLFARDGSTVYLTLEQGTETIKGGTKVLEKRNHDIRDVLPPQPDLLTKIDLKSEVQRPKSYQAGTVFAKAFAADFMPDPDLLRQDVQRFANLLTGVEASDLTFPSAEPVHLLMKWSAELRASTLTEHRELAEKHGTVWWGKSGKVGTDAISTAQLEKIRAQIVSGVPTHCYLYSSGEVWQTDLQTLTTDPRDVDTDRLPAYHGTEECNLFLELADFKPLPVGWAASYLLLASNPDPEAIAGALSNQTSPLLVFERLAGQAHLLDMSTGTDQDDIMAAASEAVSLDVEWLAARTLLEPAWLQDLLAALERRPQVILAGPPGTGKTWLAKALARYLTQDEPLAWRLTQFHPSYGYEEFIEGLRPEASSSGIVFSRVDGAVLKMANQIEEGTDQRHVLILDEMNRANLPRVFGELMYLLEYRDEPADLMYSADFSLPGSLLFIGTMNTADRSIRSLDIALRRRFEVFECAPSGAVLERYYQTHECHVDDLIEGFEKLNLRLADLLDRHRTVGHTFFMGDPMTVGLLRSTWTRQLQPLFEEYFFDQPDVAETLKLEEFWTLHGGY